MALGISGFLAWSNPLRAEFPQERDIAKDHAFYLAIPAYLYSRYSAFGIQGGYEYKKVHLRVEVSFVEEYEKGRSVMYALSSLGAFISQDWQSVIRIYEGLAFGEERGIMNSFDGRVLFLNAVAGVEFLPLGNTSFFFETGSGIAFLRKEGAFNGGTVIGGGIKYTATFFSGR